VRPGSLTDVASERLAAGAVGLSTLLVYLWSAPRTVVLEDDGFFLQAAWFNAVAHPPGYPLYVALSHLATLVPLGSVAFRVHALSAVFAASACVLLFRLARGLMLAREVATVAAMTFGVSAAFWSQAIIAEVYSLHVLLFLGCAAICVKIGDQPGPVAGRDVVLIGILSGLALSNHWPLFVMSTPMLLLLAWPAGASLWRNGIALVAGLLLGLLPYAWMIWRTHVVPEFCFAGPITNWQEFLSHVGRQGYAARDHNPGAGWWDRALFSWFVVRETARQCTWAGAMLGITGFICQWRYWPRRICWALTLGYLGSTFLLILLLGFDYDEFHRHTFRVYPLISYTVFALWIGLGLQRLTVLLPASWGMALRGIPLPYAAGALLLGLTLITHLPANYRARDTWAEVYGRAILGSLPGNAVFYSNADTVNAPVGYLHHVEGVRPDVQLASGHSLELNGRLIRPYTLSAPELQRVIAAFVAGSSWPIFYLNDFPHAYGEDFFGLYFQVNREAPASHARAILTPAIAQYYRAIAALPPPTDGWENMHLRLLRQDECRLLAALIAVTEVIKDPPTACLGLHGRLVLAQQALALDSNSGSEAARKLLQNPEALLKEAVYKKDRALFEGLYALAHQSPGRKGD